MNLTERHPLNSCPHCGLFLYACKCPREQQPSQEPKDDGEKLGPCNDVPCEEFGAACDECELNPSSPNYEEGWED